MNTRLQVEHPVTELVTGIDLVEQQFLIAAGEPPSFDPAAVSSAGHALELRVYAEDPDRFLPGPGHDHAMGRSPRARASGSTPATQAGNTVTPFYDPLLAKLCVHGADRDEALGRAGKRWPPSPSRARRPTWRSTPSCSPARSSSAGTTIRPW